MPVPVRSNACQDARNEIVSGVVTVFEMFMERLSDIGEFAATDLQELRGVRSAVVFAKSLVNMIVRCSRDL